MSIRAAEERVLVIPDESSSITDSGIILAPSKKPLPMTGKIVSIGREARKVMEIASEGMTAWFEEMAGAEFTWEGVRYYSLWTTEILAVE